MDYLYTTMPQSSDLGRLFGFLQFHCIKIIIICIIIYLIYHFINWLGFLQTQEQKKVTFYKEQTKSFKGWKQPFRQKDIPAGQLIQENLHFIVYGKTGSGKTTFMRKYIQEHFEEEDVHIFCMQSDEWKGYSNVCGIENLDMLEDVENFAGEYKQNSLLILDDAASSFKQKNISEIFTKGRHHHIRIVVLAHKACDVDMKIREKLLYNYTK